MDIKLTGITDEILERALDQAKVARLELLAHMSETIAVSREELSPFAPRMTRIQINPERIGALIGPGGKTIRSMSKRPARPSMSKTTAPCMSARRTEKWLPVPSA